MVGGGYFLFITSSMGSAAPSLRRWLSVSALGAGAVTFAFVIAVVLRTGDPGVEQGDLPEGAEVVAASDDGTVVRITATATAGWTVPADLDGSPDTDGAAAVNDPLVQSTEQPSDSEPGLTRLVAGAETVGATIEVPTSAGSVVIAGSVSRQLAIRVVGEAGPGHWLVLPLGHHEAPDGLEGDEGWSAPGVTPVGASAVPPASTPVLLPADAQRVEVIELTTTPGSIELLFLPRFAGPDVSDLAEPAAPSVGPGAPSIFPRSAWTTTGWNEDNTSCGDGPQVAPHLQAVVIHHTVTANDYGQDQVDDLLRAIHYTHTEINGWCDIGYNFVVDRFGQVWEARTDSIGQTVIGGHARGFNTGTVGVALLGQHQTGARPSVSGVSSAAQQAVQDLAAWKLGSVGADPEGWTWLRNRSSAPRQRLAGQTWHRVPTVLGHRDLGLTSCPGTHGMSLVAALPASLGDRQNQTVPYQWSDWRAHGHGPGFVVADARGGIRPAGTTTPWSAPGGSGDGPVIAIGGGVTGGYRLSSTGILQAYGAAPPIAPPALASGARDLVVRTDGTSGWILDGTGTLRGFGGAADLGGGSVDPVAAAVLDDGRGYVMARDGTLRPVGGLAPASVGLPVGVEAIDVAVAPDGSGWVLDDRGGLHGFGGQADHGTSPAGGVVAVLAAPVGPGGWVVDDRGEFWPFGGARYIFPVSTAARTSDVVDAAVAGVVYTPEFLNGSDARYITGLHELFVGRPANNAEIDLGVTALEQGGSRLALARSLANTEYWAGESLDRMYRDVLGRGPDPEGRAYWLAELSTGLRFQDLGTYFYGSQEYADRAGSSEAYVRALYQNLLGRDPDPGGLAYWVDELVSGRARPSAVASGFYASIESRRGRADTLYRRIFGIEPSDDRREELAARLPAVGDVELAAELAASSDYYGLLTNG